MRKNFTRQALRRLAKFGGPRNWRRAGRRTIALLVASAILSLYVTASSAAPNVNLKPVMGTVKATGAVQLNESPVLSGQTLFSGSRIRTSRDAESIVELGNLARLRLEAETSLMLESSGLSLSASLENGTVRVFVPRGMRSAITTADASITTDAGQTATFSVTVDACSTTLIVEAGRVEIRSLDYVRSVSSGERFSTEAPSPPEPQQNLSGRKKAGLFLGIGGAITILLIALTGKKKVTETPSFGGCVIAPSPGAPVGGC